MAQSKGKKGRATPAYSADSMVLRYVCGLLLIALGVLIFLSVAVEMDGAVFAGTKQVAFGLTGWLAVLLPVLPVWGGVVVILSTQRKPPVRAFALASVLYLLMLTAADLIARTGTPATSLMDYILASNKTRLASPDTFEAYLASAYAFSSRYHAAGGLLGMLLAWPMWKIMGVLPAAILSCLLCGGDLVLLTKLDLRKLMEKGKSLGQQQRQRSEQEQQALRQSELNWQQEQAARAAMSRGTAPMQPMQGTSPNVPWGMAQQPGMTGQQPGMTGQQPTWPQQMLPQQWPQPTPMTAPMKTLPRGRQNRPVPSEAMPNRNGVVVGFAPPETEQYGVASPTTMYQEQIDSGHPDGWRLGKAAEEKPRKSRIFGGKKAAKTKEEPQQPAYPSEEGYAQQPAYPSEEGYAPQPAYPSEEGVAPQPAYPSEEGYAPQPAYPSEDSYAPQPAYPSEEGYASQPAYPSQDSYAPQQPAYPSQDSYVPQQPAYPPQQPTARPNRPQHQDDALWEDENGLTHTASWKTEDDSWHQAQRPVEETPITRRLHALRQAGEIQPGSQTAAAQASPAKTAPAKASPVPPPAVQEAQQPRVKQQPMPSWSAEDTPPWEERPTVVESAWPSVDEHARHLADRGAYTAGRAATSATARVSVVAHEPNKTAEAWSPELKLPPRKYDEDAPAVEEPPLPPPYVYPSMTLLKTPEPQGGISDDEDALRSRRLEETLQSFKIPAKVRHVTHGPAISRFELEMAAGIKVNKVTELDRNIAMNMEVKSVRIEAPIPGKSLVGVEVPNRKVTPVTLREVLETDAMRAMKSPLGVALGKDIAGQPIVCDLARMPHLLIAGATGSGKSVCVNAMINSILFRCSPREVRMILVDPKVVELQCYNGIPHLLIPVVSDPHKAAGALEWAVAEMMERYKKFQLKGVREINGYNGQLTEDEEFMPRIVIVIDELADLMMTCRKDVEDRICRLAQLARAAGIHLVVATQRPSVDVITGLIKANIPSRIAFKVSSFVDSRTILDRPGAEKLLGYGDMLYLPNGEFTPIRVQGCFLTDAEVNRITDFIRQNSQVEYDPDVLEQLEQSSSSDSDAAAEETAADDDGSDSLLAQAIEMTVQDGQTSTSMLQRRLRVGYARAGRLVDEMEKRGIVSCKDGAKPRMCLISREEFEQLKQSGGPDEV